MNSFTNKDGGSYAWSNELEAMSAQWNKLVTGNKDQVPGSEMSYGDLSAALSKFVNKDVLPAEIVDKLPEPPAVEEPEEVDEDYVAPDDACQMGEAFLDAFGSDSDEDDDDDKPSPPKKEEPAPASPTVVKHEEEKVDTANEASPSGSPE